LLLAYGTYFESSARRATLGKQACGLIVERASGERLSVGKALGRQMLKLLGNVLSIISWLIFFLPVVFTAKKQGLHDLAVSSVVRHEPGKGMPDWLVGVCAAVVPGVAVIGMLAAIAIPAYQDYTIRAKVVAGRAQAAPLRVAVEAAYAKRGLLPNDQAELDSVAATADAGVAYRNGRIAIALNVGSKQAALFLTPVVESNGIIWKCSAENLRPANLPADCR
jgi:Tfp pilus assembly major pilin PilA